MNYTTLGRTGLKVSRLCLGTMNFGVGTEEKDAFAIMDAALDAGINFFDTANVYGWGENAGRTEEIIGRWFAQGGSRRERTVLATKVYGSMHDKTDGPNDGPGLSAYKIRRHLEGSLRRLQTDHVELYQMHHVDRGASWEELWGSFQTLSQQGKIGYVGSSNFAGWDLAVATGRSEGPRPARPRVGAAQVQSGDPSSGAGGAACGSRPGHRHHSVEPARRRACSRATFAEAKLVSAAETLAGRSSGSSSSSTASCAMSLARERMSFLSRGSCISRRLRHQSSAYARWSSSSGLCARWSSSWTSPRCSAWTRSSQDPGGEAPKAYAW